MVLEHQTHMHNFITRLSKTELQAHGSSAPINAWSAMRQLKPWECQGIWCAPL